MSINVTQGRTQALATTTEYRSEYGWTISLPAGWEKLEDVGSASLTGCKPVVFSTPQDWSVAITWMRSPRPWPRDVVVRFDTLTATDGPVPVSEADAFLKVVFGTAGTVTEARTLTLNTGERGLEVIEFIGSGVTPRCGYQLVTAVPEDRLDPALLLSTGAASYFDRVVFYADAAKFGKMLVQVRETCQKYRHVFMRE